MWWRTGFVYLLVLYRQSLPHPITPESEYDRETRQVHIDECCPCAGMDDELTDDQQFKFPGQTTFNSESEDCPCRSRQGDPEGAASIFFPTRVRAAGTTGRQANKKENLKPLLHPEVDLASSVLETIREATNDDYREALARDAIRDAVKISGLSEATMLDTAPEESRNIVTIIVKPNQDFEDDFVQQASHIKESRCIHAPLGNSRKAFGKLRAVPKTPNIYRDIFRLPTSRPVGLLHRNLMDMDNNVGASTVQERVVNPEVRHDTNRNVNLRQHGPLLKLKQIQQSLSPADDDSSCNVNNNPNLESILTPKMFKYPGNVAFPLHHTIADKNIESLLPRMRLGSLLHEDASRKGEMDGSPSVKEEQTVMKPELKEIPAKINIEDILENLKMKNLLKLRDAELIPSRISKTPLNLARPHLFLPLAPENNGEPLNHRDNRDNNSGPDKIYNNSNKNTLYTECANETEEDDNRDVSVPKQGLANVETEILDTVSNPTNIVYFDTSRPNSDNCENESQAEQLTNSSIMPSEVLTDPDCDVLKTHHDITSDQPFLTISGDNNKEETQNDGANDCETNEEHCSRNENNCELSPSTNLDHNSEPQGKILEDKSSMPEVSTVNKNVKTLQNIEATTPKSILINNPKDNTLITLKEKLINTLENLQNTDLKSILNKNKLIKEDSVIVNNKDEKPDNVSDCLDNKPETSQKTSEGEVAADDDVENIDNQNQELVTMQDLQKMSDLMLQKEEEAELIPEASNYIENTANSDLNTSTNPQIESVPNIRNENIDENVNNCHSDLSKSPPVSHNNMKDVQTSKIDDKDVTEMNTDTSNNIINILPHENINLGNKLELPSIFDDNTQLTAQEDGENTLKTRLATVRDFFKLDPLPTLDNIDLKLPKIFDTNERVEQEDILSEEQGCASEFTSTMQTDASTPKFQVQSPPLKENFNIDMLRLKPITMPLSNLSHKDNKIQKSLTGLPNKIRANNINGLDTGLTRTVTDVIDNFGDKLPKIDELWNKMRSNTHELLSVPSLLENSNDKLRLSNANAKNPIKKIQPKMKSTKNDLNLRNPIPSRNLMQVIAEKHEDLNDKLRAVHIDLADRLDSMRNSIINPVHNDKITSKIKPHIDSIANSKDRQSTLKKPKNFTLRNEFPNKTVKKPAKLISTQPIEKRPFQMPYAASVQIPKTLDAPKLKSISDNLNTPTLQNSNNFKDTEISPVRTSTILAKQPIKDLYKANKLNGNQINPFQNNNIKVSFSTSPRPPTHNLSMSKSNNELALQFKEPNEALSERKSMTPATNILPIDRTSDTERDSNDHLISSHSDNDRDKIKNKLLSTRNKILKWPQPTEGSFLAKVTDAVTARRLVQPNVINKLGNKSISRDSFDKTNQSAVDMLRSPSETISNNEALLKENVSYRCKMICTRE